MAQLSKIPKVYAKALLDYLQENERRQTALKEIEAVAKISKSHEELSRVFTSEVFSEKERVEVVADLGKKLSLSKEVQNLLRLLAENNRLDYLGSIGEQFRLQMLEESGVVPVLVQTASALSNDEQKQIENKFSQILGKPVQAEYSENGALLGGLKASAAGQTYNGSLSGWLDAIEEKLVGG